MTPEERAEKISKENIFILKAACGDPLIVDIVERKTIVKVIATEIRAAMNEALEKMAWGNLQAEARTAAYEDAAKIVEEHPNIGGVIKASGDGCMCGVFAAEVLRARAKEVK